MPCVTDLEGCTYLQQERKGVILGVYERNPRHWQTEGAEWDYGMELLPEDIDRISPELLIGFARFPSLQRAGIRKWVNGAFTFTPDGNPLVGPVPGLRNFWAACGCMGGFSQGGAIGKVLSDWMVEGDPGTDIFGMDVARYGKFAADDRYLRDTTAQFYARRFVIAYPNEELPAGRPLKTTPSYAGAAGARRALRRGLGHGVAAVFRDGRTGFRRTTDVATVRRGSIRRSGSRRDAQLRQDCWIPACTRATKCADRARKSGSTTCSPRACPPWAASVSRRC